MNHVATAIEKTFQSLGIQCRIDPEGMIIEYKVPDNVRYGINQRGDKVQNHVKPGGWTGVHVPEIHALKHFCIRIANNGIKITEQLVLDNMPHEVDKLQKPVGRPKKQSNSQ